MGELEKKQELFMKKLKNDRRWYIENFLKIRNKQSKLVPFKFNDAQEIFYDLIQKCDREKTLKRFIVLKARQMGLSTFSEGLIFSHTANTPFINSLIIAHEEKASQNLFQMSKLYYEELPNVIRPMKKYSNEKALTFENPSNDESEKQKNPGLRSKITVATANTTETGRSSTIHNLHASEVAFFAQPEKTMLGLLQCVPDTMDTTVILESTANGVGDYFHRMWQQATRGENDFIPIFLPWFTDKTYTKPFPSQNAKEQFIEEVNDVQTDIDGNEIHTTEYLLKEKFNLTYEQLNWRRWCIANKCAGDEELFNQEYPSTPEDAFIASGRPVFSTKALKKYQTATKEGEKGYLKEINGKVTFVPDKSGYIEIWKHPQKDMHYSIGADVAEGVIDGDYSTAMVGNTDFDVVAMWHGHIDPDLFGMELVKLAKYYNDAYLGIEANNHGHSVIRRVKDLEYWNIYYMKTYDKIADQMTQKVGWHTNSKTKPLMIDKLAEFIREFYLGLYSDLIISEGYTYVIDEKGSTNAQEGCHDDTIMALAILLQLLLEGKGDNYIPEIPEDRLIKSKRRRVKEIVDPLFEKDGDEYNPEIAE